MNVYIQNKLKFTKYEGRNDLSVSAVDNSIRKAMIPQEFMGLPVAGIDENGFYGCSRLESVSIPDSITDIGLDAFEGCGSIREVHAQNVDAWCKITFWNSQSSPIFCGEGATLYINGIPLTELDVPCGVTEIKPYAFKGVSSLKSVTLPDSVTTIGHSAFFGCTSLENVIPSDSIEYIGEEAFLDCTSLKNIEFSNKLTSIKDLTFCGCTSLLDVILPCGISSVGNRAFYGCTALSSVALPNTLEYIGNEAFWGCTSLIRPGLPHSIKAIGVRAFTE